MSILYQLHDRGEAAKSLADFLPSGELFKAKSIPSSNLYKMLYAMSIEILRAEDALHLVDTEIDPSKTDLYIEEWESAVGIPDGCFTGTGTIEERRRDVMVKLASSGVQTADDFEELALMLGVAVQVVAGADIGVVDHPELPVATPPLPELRYMIYVFYGFSAPNIFALDYPIPFGTAAVNFLKCIFDRLIPANCETYFQGTVAPVSGFSSGFGSGFR